MERIWVGYQMFLNLTWVPYKYDELGLYQISLVGLSLVCFSSVWSALVQFHLVWFVQVDFIFV